MDEKEWGKTRVLKHVSSQSLHSEIVASLPLPHFDTKGSFSEDGSGTEEHGRLVKYVTLLFRHRCSNGKYTIRKIQTKLHPGLEGVFSINIDMISMISLISSLSLKLYFNSLVYDRNIFGSSSKVFEKCSGAFVWSWEQFCKIFGNLRKSKTPSSVCLYSKKNITR